MEAKLLVPLPRSRFFLSEGTPLFVRTPSSRGQPASPTPFDYGSASLYLEHKMDHLACFLPATIAVALHHGTHAAAPDPSPTLARP